MIAIPRNESADLERDRPTHRRNTSCPDDRVTGIIARASYQGKLFGGGHE